MIKVEQVAFSYNKKPFIQNINFEVEQGEILGFLGPSGAGKSTLQKILIGLLSNYQGSVRVFDKEVKDYKDEYYEKIGIDFEFPSLYEKMTAKENLQFFASLYSKKCQNINELLEEVGLTRDADKKVIAFSKGMKSRLNFIKALVNAPEILFLDEPTSGLDPANSRLMKNMIIKEKQKGTTIIITTHNMQDAAELCDRVAFIVDGEVRALDTPHNLIMQKGATKLKYTYLENGIEQQAECELTQTGRDLKLLTLLKEGSILTAHTCEPDLGDIFLDITGRGLA